MLPVYASFRNETWAGLAQNVSVEAGEIYIMSTYIKLIEVTEGQMYEDVRMTLACTDREGNITRII